MSPGGGGVLSGLTARDVRLVGACLVVGLVAGVLRYAGGGNVAPFAVSAVALALLASLVGRSVEALGDRLGAGATGVVQSALGNLPELFVVLFALHAGLYDVVRAAIVGSILANVLLVLAVAALLVPSLTANLHTAASGHERVLSIIVSVVLLGLFALSLPMAIRRGGGAATAEPDEGHAAEWSLGLAIGMLAGAGVAAALVSDWFVHGLEPAIESLGISQTFAGLVIVAVAGNAVENVVGIQLAARNKADYALSVILQSPLQIALVLAPVVVLAAPLVGATFTLVLSPLLIAVLAIAVIVTVLVVLDGESNWFEGATLIALYAIIAAAFWWG